MKCKVVQLEHARWPQGLRMYVFFQKKYFLKILNIFPDFAYTVVGDNFNIIRRLDF